MTHHCTNFEKILLPTVFYQLLSSFFIEIVVHLILTFGNGNGNEAKDKLAYVFFLLP